MFSNYLDSFDQVLRSTQSFDKDGNSLDLDTSYNEVVHLLEETRKQRKTVFLIGNGGSSGIVSHGAIDFLNACGFKAHALTDNSLLTCMANDYGYENVFAQPFKTLLEEDDVVVAISSSGNSMNIVNACQIANEKNAKVITLSGFSETNKLKKEGDFNFWLSDNHYGRVEIGHSLILHYITDQLAVKK